MVSDHNGAPNVGAPHRYDARTARAVHTVLGERGAIGSGRNAVAYAFHTRCGAYHIAPVRAYTAEPHAPHARAIVRMGAYDAEGTGDVRVSDPWDGTRSPIGAHRAVRATLTGARDARVLAYWNDRTARERAAHAPYVVPHVCERERTERTRRCTCAAFGGERHTHRPGDGRVPDLNGAPCDRIHNGAPCDVCDANTARYRATLARINARTADDTTLAMLPAVRIMHKRGAH